MGPFGFFKKRDREARPRGQPAPRTAELVRQLDDPDPARRRAACEELAEMGSEAEAATAKLQELIHDDDGDVCLAAAAALSRIERED